MTMKDKYRMNTIESCLFDLNKKFWWRKFMLRRDLVMIFNGVFDLVEPGRWVTSSERSNNYALLLKYITSDMN